jgi:F-type H+-transporting ATPase subunit b
MLDIHFNWLIVLMVNFLCLIFVLNILLFKPLLKIFKEREDSVKGSLDAARDMNSRKEEGILRMNRELTEARGKAKVAFEDLRNEGLNTQKTFMSDAEVQASGMLQRAREELRSEVVRARGSLRSDVEKFADDIVRKLVNA